MSLSEDINIDDNMETGSWSQLIENTDYRINRRLGIITLLGNNTSEYIAVHYTIINNDINDTDDPEDDSDSYYGLLQSSGTRIHFDECNEGIDCCPALLEGGGCDAPEDSWIETNLAQGFQGKDQCLIQDEQGNNICENNDTSLIEGEDYKENNGERRFCYW